MGFFKRLIGKSEPDPPADAPPAGRLKSGPASIDQFIAAWLQINGTDSPPWVLFEHGTCVRLPHPEQDVLAQARALLREWGPVYPGSSSGDFDVKRVPGVTGWLITCHHRDIVTYVAMPDAESHHRRGGDASDIALGLFGRSLRDKDARELGAIHIEDRRPNADVASAEAVQTWARLVQRGWQAHDARSDWGRYAIPLAGIEFLTDEQSTCPARSLDDIPMPAEVRAEIECLESVVRQCGRLPEPVTVLSGLALSGTSDASTADLRGLFAPGQVVELKGFLSGSAVVEPPLYAAGAKGAMLEIGVHSAADMSQVMPRQGEAEYLLPRDCRCRVLGTVPDRSYRTQDADHCVRPAVQLQQL